MAQLTRKPYQRLACMQDPSGNAANEAQKHLTLYELDLGLNHVVRKWSEPVDNGANMLIPVPGGGSGPGGVLICSENFIIYKNEDHEDVRAVIPRRSDLSSDRGVLITSYATHKQKALIYFFVQVIFNLYNGAFLLLSIVIRYQISFAGSNQ